MTKIIHNNKFELNQLSTSDENLFSILHKWDLEEKERELHTCKPISPIPDFEIYLKAWKSQIDNKIIHVFGLFSEKEMVGKISYFKFNSRNYSAEFGYYLPPKYRSKGIGKIMLKLFLDKLFSNEDLKLNCLYATTAACNIKSNRLLESLGFKLEGHLREHYRIGKEVHDELCYSILKREWMSRNF